MITFRTHESNIHLIARGLIFRGEEIILCRGKGQGYFFLPGGHVEDGEPARMALVRELREEIGDNNYQATSLLGVCENIFSLEEGLLQHEVNFVFKVEVPLDSKMDSAEDHLEFISIKREDLKDYNIMPEKIKEGLLEWLDNGKQFLKEL